MCRACNCRAKPSCYSAYPPLLPFPTFSIPLQRTFYDVIETQSPKRKATCSCVCVSPSLLPLFHPPHPRSVSKKLVNNRICLIGNTYPCLYLDFFLRIKYINFSFFFFFIIMKYGRVKWKVYIIEKRKERTINIKIIYIYRVCQFDDMGHLKKK